MARSNGVLEQGAFARNAPVGHRVGRQDWALERKAVGYAGPL